MHIGTASVHADLVRLAVIVVVALVAGAALTVQRRRLEARWRRPLLPPDDRPPVGLGRLVPMGAQIEDECRRGFAALERWMLTHPARPSGP